MPKFSLTFPIAGTITVEVETENDSKKEAISRGLAVDWRINFDSENPDVTLDTIDAYEHLVQGNVLYAPLNEVSVERLPDEDDE